MTKRWPFKDPDDVLDYSLDWTSWLDEGDTVASVVWDVPEPLVEGAASEEDGVTTVFISGGEHGEKYIVGCRITTTGGRTRDQSVELRVRTR